MFLAETFYINSKYFSRFSFDTAMEVMQSSPPSYSIERKPSYLAFFKARRQARTGTLPSPITVPLK